MSAWLYHLRDHIGGTVYGARGTFPGPGHSRRDRSLSLWDTGGRIVAYSFAGDGYRELSEYLRGHGVAIADAKELTEDEKKAWAKARRAEKARRAAEVIEQRRLCADLWAAAAPVGGAALAYLRSRGIPAEVIDVAARHDLRFAAAAPCRPYEPDGRTAPAMVAKVTDRAGALLGAHVTYLDDGGGDKRYRLMLAPQSGGVVRLAQAGETLAVAEGIETALAFTALHAIPCWAARTALGVEQFRPPDGVRKVIIAADGDAAGLRAADVLQADLVAFVRVERADAPMGYDWNDVLRGQADG